MSKGLDHAKQAVELGVLPPLLTAARGPMAQTPGPLAERTLTLTLAIAITLTLTPTPTLTLTLALALTPQVPAAARALL